MAALQPNRSRRKFIKKNLLASTLFIVPRHVLGGVGYTAPSDQLNIAGIGVGGKGSSDILNASVGGRERVVALCDIDPRGAHGVLHSRKQFSGARFYTDFRRLLDQEKDLDAVTISTPDHTHAVIAAKAMLRGKHVYVQKPLSHNIREVRLLTEMAREQRVVTQMGNQGASNPDQQAIADWVDKKIIGKIHKIQVWTNRPVWPQGIVMPKAQAAKQPDELAWDLWLGPAKKTPYNPALHPFNWRGWWAYGTGALGDMGCHIIDIPFRALKLGHAKDVECSIGSVFTKMWSPEYIPEGCPPSSYVSMHFPPSSKNDSPVEMVWTDGGIRPPHPALIPAEEDLTGVGNENGVIMIGEKGIITAGPYGISPKLHRKGLPPLSHIADPSRSTTRAPEWGHQQAWIDACKAGFNSKEHQKLTASFDYAGPLTEAVLMGNIAIRSYLLRRKKSPNGFDYFGRKKLRWNGKEMRVTNLEQANQFVGRDYRKGWELF